MENSNLSFSEIAAIAKPGAAITVRDTFFAADIATHSRFNGLNQSSGFDEVWLDDDRLEVNGEPRQLHFVLCEKFNQVFWTVTVTGNLALGGWTRQGLQFHDPVLYSGSDGRYCVLREQSGA